MYRKKIYEKYLTHNRQSELSDIENSFNAEFYIDENIKDALPKNKEAKILDIGCGYGRYLKYLKDLGYKNVQGVEIGKEQNTFLKEKDINVIDSDIFLFLENTKEKFDFVSMFDVLEHFTKSEIVKLLPLLQKILTDDGVLIVRVPNGEGISSGGIMYGDFTHETFFTNKSLKQIFNIFEFSNVDVHPAYPIKHGVKSIFRSYGYKVFEVLFKLLLVLETGSAKNAILTRNLYGIIKR